MGRRIGGADGGSDPGSGGRTGLAVAAVVLTGLAATGGGVSLGAATPGGAGSSVAGPDISARKAASKKSARAGKPDEAWNRLGMRSLRKTKRTSARCVANSFGEIREFFIRTPCRSLDRMLFGIGDEQGNVVIVSVAWTGFASRDQARDFEDLNEVHGTGDIVPLAGALLDMADVSFTGHHYQSRQDGSTVVTAETEAAAGRIPDDVLDTVAEVAVLLPRP
ncbi:MAG: hypothetical protein ABW215_14280 [Kibdelosporangium sp.]